MSITYWLAIASGIVVSEAHADPAVVDMPHHVAETTAVIDASPTVIYDLVTDYAHWPAILSDVTSVKVEAGGRRDAKVRFRSKALEHEVAIVFDNVPGRVIRFHSVDAPPGAHAHGEYVLEPIDGGTRTKVTAQLYLDVSWPTSWLIRDSKVRAMRRAKVLRDVSDVVRRFAPVS